MNEIASLHVSLRGEFRMVVNAGTENESDTGWRPNLVLDSGLDQIANRPANKSSFDYCSVGTGTTAPANSQTALVSYLASQQKTSSSASNLGSPTYAGQYNATYTFTQGAVTGNISEFGVGTVSGGGSLFSRCLIVDTSGSPTTITLTTIDQLTVYYRLTLTPNVSDSTGSVTLAGTSYPYTLRIATAPSFFSSYLAFESWAGGTVDTENPNAAPYAYGASSTIGSVTSQPSGTAYHITTSSSALATYTAGNFYRDGTLTILSADWNATGGIGALFIQFSGMYSGAFFQYGFSTPIPKDNTRTLTLTFRSSWGR